MRSCTKHRYRPQILNATKTLKVLTSVCFIKAKQGYPTPPPPPDPHHSPPHFTHNVCTSLCSSDAFRNVRERALVMWTLAEHLALTASVWNIQRNICVYTHPQTLCCQLTIPTLTVRISPEVISVNVFWNLTVISQKVNGHSQLPAVGHIWHTYMFCCHIYVTGHNKLRVPVLHSSLSPSVPAPVWIFNCVTSDRSLSTAGSWVHIIVSHLTGPCVPQGHECT
jgi:hypothetical protein